MNEGLQEQHKGHLTRCFQLQKLSVSIVMPRLLSYFRECLTGVCEKAGSTATVSAEPECGPAKNLMWGGRLLQIQTQPQILSDLFSLRLRLAYRDPNCDPFCNTNVRHPLLPSSNLLEQSFEHPSNLPSSTVSIREPLTTFKQQPQNNLHHGSVPPPHRRNGKHHCDPITSKIASTDTLTPQVRTTSSTSTWSSSATSTPESRPPPVT